MSANAKTHKQDTDFYKQVHKKTPANNPNSADRGKTLQVPPLAAASLCLQTQFKWPFGGRGNFILFGVLGAFFFFPPLFQSLLFFFFQ